MPEVLVRQSHDGVVTLTLNRPKRLNALNTELVSDLILQLDSIADTTSAVVIKGAGRAFCAGMDLKDESNRPATKAGRRHWVEQLQEVTRALQRCRAPVIAVVHGYAVGGGAEIALSCDLLIAAEDAQIGFPETGIGVTVTGGMSHTLGRLLGPLTAKRMVLLGETVTGNQAMELGLACRTAPEPDLERCAAELVELLKTRSAHAIRQSKRMINQALDWDLETAISDETKTALQLSTSSDTRRRTDAFRKRRRRDPSAQQRRS